MLHNLEATPTHFDSYFLRLRKYALEYAFVINYWILMRKLRMHGGEEQPYSFLQCISKLLIKGHHMLESFQHLVNLLQLLYLGFWTSTLMSKCECFVCQIPLCG